MKLNMRSTNVNIYGKKGLLSAETPTQGGDKCTWKHKKKIGEHNMWFPGIQYTKPSTKID